MCPGRSLPGWCSRHRARAQRLAHDKREQRGSVSPATRLQRSQEIWVTTNRHWRREPASDSDAGPGADPDAGPGADADAGPGGDHHLRNKTGFPPRTRPYTRAVPSAAARKTQDTRAHPPNDTSGPSRRHAQRVQWPFSTTYGRMLPRGCVPMCLSLGCFAYIIHPLLKYFAPAAGSVLPVRRFLYAIRACFPATDDEIADADAFSVA